VDRDSPINGSSLTLSAWNYAPPGQPVATEPEVADLCTTSDGLAPRRRPHRVGRRWRRSLLRVGTTHGSEFFEGVSSPGSRRARGSPTESPQVRGAGGSPQQAHRRNGIMRYTMARLVEWITSS
jgi:hypothetical protein